MSRDTTCEKPVESFVPSIGFVHTKKPCDKKNFVFIIISISTFMKLA